MLCHIFTLELSRAMAVSKYSTAAEGLHCAARPPQNNVTVCISWLCNRFPKREMAQGQSHTIKINVSAVYQDALGSQHATAAPYLRTGSLVSNDIVAGDSVLLEYDTASLGNRFPDVSVYRCALIFRDVAVDRYTKLLDMSPSSVTTVLRLPDVKKEGVRPTAAFADTGAQPV